jgi:hypothetical protein
LAVVRPSQAIRCDATHLQRLLDQAAQRLSLTDAD